MKGLKKNSILLLLITFVVLFFVVKDDIIPWYDEKGILFIGIQEFLLDEKTTEGWL